MAMQTTTILLLTIVLVIRQRGSDAAAVVTMKDVVNRDLPDSETTLSEADFSAASSGKVAELAKSGLIKSSDGADPLSGKYAEGDIALSDPKAFVESNNKLGRNAIKDPYRLWPKGEIPYALSTQYGQFARATIAAAMDEYQRKTCIRFIPKNATHRDWVWIHADEGCYSLVGKTGGRQPLSLDGGCIAKGTIMHELMHTVGFFHEQSRTDRDDHIDIVWRNVQSGANDQFQKYDLRQISNLGEAYDYGSIMHYGPYAFSGNGKKTILPKRQGAERLGQRDTFSGTDLRKINKLYNCAAAAAASSGGNSVQAPPPPPPQQAAVEVAAAAVVDEKMEQVEDTDWHCPFFALPALGFCDQYAEIRRVVCPKSCSASPPAGGEEEEEEKEGGGQVTENGIVEGGGDDGEGNGIVVDSARS